MTNSRENMQRWLKLVCAVACMVVLWFGAIWRSVDYRIAPALHLLQGLVLYHVAVRVVVGIVMDKRPLETFNPLSTLFRPRSWEARLYKNLQVKVWKNNMPVFNSAKWDLRSRGVGEVLRAGCQAEAVHGLNIAFGFVAVFLGPVSGIPDVGVLLFAAVTAGAFELPFILIQRFNRPRLLRLAEREHRSAPSSLMDQELRAAE